LNSNYFVIIEGDNLRCVLEGNCGHDVVGNFLFDETENDVGFACAWVTNEDY